jgi:site-specific recombinase XerD
VRLDDGAGIIDGFRFWLDTRYHKRIATVTATNYHSQAKQWVHWCEDNDLDFKRATQEDMAIYLGELRRTMAPLTVRHRLTAMCIFYDYAVYKGYCKENHARALPNPRVQGRPTPEFTQQEIRRMYEACKDHRERAVFLLLLSGGLRLTEVFGITSANVNTEQGTIMVLGKGSQYRMIAPGAMAMQALERALELNDRLVPYAWPHYIDNLVKRLGKAAGVQGRVHAHRFRHMFATSFLDAGGSIEDLQQVLGHARIEMSLHYSKAGRARRAMQAQQRIDLASRFLSESIMREAATLVRPAS